MHISLAKATSQILDHMHQGVELTCLGTMGVEVGGAGDLAL